MSNNPRPTLPAPAAHAAPAGRIEALEPRRLLAATLDAASGVLTITGSDTANDIVQFQVGDALETNGRATSFTVLESTSTAAAPARIPTRTAVLDYIATGGTPASTSFDLTSVNNVVIRTFNGDDLVIVGGTLPVPVLVDGGGGNDSISGGEAADSIGGGNGDDYVFGRGGNDIVSGDFGTDDIYGGAGFDYTEYRNRTNTVTVGIGNIADDGEIGEGDNVRNDIEGIIGGSGDDELGADNSNLDPNLGVILIGGDGNDLLVGFGGNDTLIGGAGNDTLNGGGGSDFLYAQDGDSTTADNDTLDGGAGFDYAIADDTPGGTATSDTVTNVELDLGDVIADPNVTGTGSGTLSDGTLTVSGTDGADYNTVQPSTDGTGLFVTERTLSNGVLTTNAVTRYNAADVSTVDLGGGRGRDLLAVLGTLGTDVTIGLNGGNDADTVVGGLGDDFLTGGDGNDYLFGRAGDDVLRSDAGADYLSGGTGGDAVDYAGRSGDLLVGVGLLPDDGERGETDNVLTDVETVIGGSGNDNLSASTISTPIRFVGNAGNDTLVGGGGDDFFVANDGQRDTIFGNGGNDDGDFDDDDTVDLGDGQ